MPGLLNASPADVLRYAMAAQGLGSLPSADPPAAWPISVGSDSTVDNMIVLTNTTGRGNGRVQWDEVQGYHGIQVKVRSVVQPVGYSKAYAVGQALSSFRNLDVNVVTPYSNPPDPHPYRIYTVIWDGSVNELGKEEASDRSLFTLNLLVHLRMLT